MNDQKPSTTIESEGFSVDFRLPPIARATLLSVNDCDGSLIATITRGYTQVYSTDPPTPEERTGYLEQIRRTRLQTPLQFIQTVWLLEDVTRAFTHQLVRYRIGTQFVQESMRFADKRKATVLITPAIAADATHFTNYMESVMDTFQTYAAMVADGIPVQDARGVLPHHVTTSIFFGCSLATFAHIYEQRMCCQAQHHEWPLLVQQMKAQLPADLQQFVLAPWETGKVGCGFGATFDRPCSLSQVWPGTVTNGDINE